MEDALSDLVGTRQGQLRLSHLKFLSFVSFQKLPIACFLKCDLVKGDLCNKTTKSMR